MTSAMMSRVAVKTSEGYGRPEEELPVDIDHTKLIDWLVHLRSFPAPPPASPPPFLCS